MNRLVYVDSFDIDSIEYFNVRRIDNESLPTVDIKKSGSASADGEVATNLYYRNKPIMISGEIAAPGHDAMQSTLQQLLRRINGVNKTLKIVVNGDIIQYTASLENMTTREALGGYLDVKLMFVAHDPIGTSEGYYTVASSSILSTPNNVIIPQGGTYFAKPIITVHFSAINTTNPNTVSINTSIGAMAVTRDWAAGETLVINCETGDVTVGAVRVDFTGSFPLLDIADSTETVAYSDQFDTSRTALMTVRYKKRYL